MKKLNHIKMIIALGVVALISFDSFASSFNLRLAQPGIYDVYVDGIVYPIRGNSLDINHVTPGHTEIRIVHHARNPRRNPRAASRLIYRDVIHIPPRTRMNARLGRYGMDIDYAPLRRNQQCMVEPVYETQFYGMHPQDFDRLVFNLDQASFDRTKMDIARVAIQNNGISTNQLAVVLESMSFDSHRLELAKFAYAYCADPGNFYQLANAFTFESNARRLMHYIS